jgi:hypothetical protein
MKKVGCRPDGDLLMYPHYLIEAAAKHAAFLRARGRHYSNEAEAMKVCYFFYLSFRCINGSLSEGGSIQR